MILKFNNIIQSCFGLSEITFVQLITNSKWLKHTQTPSKRYRSNACTLHCTLWLRL